MVLLTEVTGSIGFTCYKRGILSHLNFARCLHVAMISDLVLSVMFGSAFAITSFSVRHKLHLRAPHL